MMSGEELTPEVYEQVRAKMLADLERRRTRSDQRRAALRQHATVIIDQALGTVIGGALLFLGGVAGGVLDDVEAATITAVGAISFGAVVGLALAARMMPAPEEIGLYHLEREAAWQAWQRQKPDGGAAET